MQKRVTLPEYFRTMATIVHADVVGYSRLISADEDGTLQLLNERLDMCREIAERHDGRLFGDIADSFMIEFGQPTDAVLCACAIQSQMAAADTPDRTLTLRLGINLGWVLSDGDRLYGDGVNIAARLQKEASPGGIALSQAVRAQVADKLSHSFRSLGPKRFHNIAVPVEVYEIEAQAPRAEMQSVGVAELIGQATVAVLPFTLGDDSASGAGFLRDMRFYGEAVASDLIKSLTRNRWMTLISRHSTFLYDRDQLGLDALAISLGAEFVISGSVETVGDTLRVVARIEDAGRGETVWSRHYSAPYFAVTDIHEQIGWDLSAVLSEKMARDKRAESDPNAQRVETWQLIHRGNWHMKLRTRRDTDLAFEHYSAALKREPDNNDAILGLAWWHFWQAWLAHGSLRSVELLLEVEVLCARAMLIDGLETRAHAFLGMCMIMRNEPDKALTYLDEALRLDASYWMAHSARGSAYLQRGEPQVALESLRRAVALNPADPALFHNHGEIAAACLFSDDLDGAIAAAERASTLAPGYWYAQLVQIVARVERGTEEDRTLAKLLRHDLESGDSRFEVKKIGYIPYRDASYHARLKDGLLRA